MTSKTLNITKLVTDADFLSDAQALGKRADAVQMDVHRHLYAIAVRWHDTGDIRPAVKRVNDLIGLMPKGVRVNAIREWVEVMFGFEYVEKTKDAAEHFKAGAIKGADLPMDTILHKRWFEIKQEAPYKPLDFGADLAKLLKRAGERCNSAKGDNVPKGLLDAVSKAAAQWNAENAA